MMYFLCQMLILTSVFSLLVSEKPPISRFSHDFKRTDENIHFPDDSIWTDNEISLPGYFKWTDKRIASTSLFCENCCKNPLKEESCFSQFFRFVGDQLIVCCIERSIPFWNFNPYNNSMGILLAVGDKIVNSTTNTNYHSSKKNKIHGKYSSVSSFPTNVCQFHNIVEINLQNQSIREIPVIDCLKDLDTLVLSSNKIVTINASTFVHMPNLRVLDLSGNQISYIEPNSFKYSPRSLAEINLNFNKLVSIDITNVVLEYVFFKIWYDQNEISTLTNLQHWEGLEEDHVEGGRISARNNSFSRIQTPQQLGFRNIQSLLMRFAFKYRLFIEGNPWYCDCEMYKYIEISSRAVSHFDAIGVECASPVYLKGIIPITVHKDPTILNLFVCNITLKERCPPLCKCFKQPSLNRVMVNCSSSYRKKMPKVVPDMDNLEIDLSFNRITLVENLSYLNRTLRLNLSHNKIIRVDLFLFSLPRLKFLNLENNYISTLDRSVQQTIPCQLHFGIIRLGNCICEMQWIKIWLLRETCSNIKNIITCVNKGQDVNIELISIDQLCPHTQEHFTTFWTSVAMVTFLIMVIAITYVNFRHEVKLIYRTWRKLNSVPKRHGTHEFDVYLSFDVENDYVRTWTVDVLDTFLHNNRFKVCIPYRDFVYGGIHVEQICSYVAKSKAFIIVLSQSFLNSQLQMIELKHLWNSFISNELTKLVIINFDLLESKDIRDKKVKALIRTGHSIEFCNYDKQLLSEIESEVKVRTPYEMSVF